MLASLYFLRHGNTFEDDQVPYWVGAGQDLPLTKKGRLQAGSAARFFINEKINLGHIFSGSLLRLKETAEIIGRELGVSSSVDPRLNEIDYGAWGGLNDEQIIARGDKAILHAWKENGRWPNGIFPDKESETQKEMRDFLVWLMLNQKLDSPYLIISSNGKIRYALGQIPGALEAAKQRQILKVSPGHLCHMELSDAGGQVKFWNKSPSV